MEVSLLPKYQISALKIMAICVQLHANVSKQTMLLDGVDVHPPGFSPQIAPYVGLA